MSYLNPILAGLAPSTNGIEHVDIGRIDDGCSRAFISSVAWIKMWTISGSVVSLS